MSDYLVHAIDPERLASIRAAGHDEPGNPFTVSPAAGWEPLRCCLQIANAEEAIALIGYASLAKRSASTKVKISSLIC